MLYNMSSFYTIFHCFIEKRQICTFKKMGVVFLAKKKPLREYRCEHPTFKNHQIWLNIDYKIYNIMKYQLLNIKYRYFIYFIYYFIYFIIFYIIFYIFGPKFIKISHFTVFLYIKCPHSYQPMAGTMVYIYIYI